MSRSSESIWEHIAGYTATSQSGREAQEGCNQRQWHDESRRCQQTGGINLMSDNATTSQTRDMRGERCSSSQREVVATPTVAVTIAATAVTVAVANATTVGIVPDGYVHTNPLPQIPTKQSVPANREHITNPNMEDINPIWLTLNMGIS